MSGKITDTKLPEGTDQDSGYISCEIKPEDSGPIADEKSHEIKPPLLEFSTFTGGEQVPIDLCKSEPGDSGVIVITEDLSHVKVTLEEPRKHPSVTIEDTRLHTSVDKNQLPPLEVLFGQDLDGDTQLHIAAVHGCEKAVSILIKVCPNKEWFNIPNDEGMTPLHLAALSGNAIVTRMLVLAGASIAVRDRQGETPVHKATVLKNKECIKALLSPVQEHHQHQQRRFSAVVDQKNYNGQACVHLAASAGHIETLQTLLYYGADINSTENLAGWTALHIAAVRGDGALAACLRAAGARRVLDHARRSPRRRARAHRALLAAWPRHADSGSDTDYDSDEQMYDDMEESLFEEVRENMGSRLVA